MDIYLSVNYIAFIRLVVIAEVNMKIMLYWHYVDWYKFSNLSEKHNNGIVFLKC
jgi:hypothetical protein